MLCGWNPIVLSQLEKQKEKNSITFDKGSKLCGRVNTENDSLASIFFYNEHRPDEHIQEVEATIVFFFLHCAY